MMQWKDRFWVVPCFLKVLLVMNAGNPLEAGQLNCPSEEEKGLASPLVDETRSSSRAHIEVPAQPPRQLEEGTVHSQVEAAEDKMAKFQKQEALGLLTFNAGTLINIKGMIMPSEAHGGRSLASRRFYYASVIAWFISLLCASVIVLANIFKHPSQNLVKSSKIFNCAGMCITVVTKQMPLIAAAALWCLAVSAATAALWHLSSSAGRLRRAHVQVDRWCMVQKINK